MESVWKSFLVLFSFSGGDKGNLHFFLALKVEDEIGSFLHWDGLEVKLHQNGVLSPSGSLVCDKLFPTFLEYSLQNLGNITHFDDHIELFRWIEPTNCWLVYVIVLSAIDLKCPSVWVGVTLFHGSDFIWASILWSLQHPDFEPVHHKKIYKVGMQCI